MHLVRAAHLILISTAVCLSLQSAHADSKQAKWVGDDFLGIPCSGNGVSYGPYDYRKRNKYWYELSLVEGAHFNHKVERLISGAKKKHHMTGDIDYTLRAFPNHHRALNTLTRYRIERGHKGEEKPLSKTECYFQRALYFAPDDGTTHLLYAIFLHKLDKLEASLKFYQQAEKLQPKNIEVKYNLGLLLVDMKRYEEAVKYAQQAYAKRYPLQGLKNRLKRKGYNL